jgi:hypothetical protein
MEPWREQEKIVGSDASCWKGDSMEFSMEPLREQSIEMVAKIM